MYHLHFNSKQYGPYTEDQVRAMFVTGKIPANVWVFQEGGVQQWQPIQKFPQLLQTPSKHAQALAVDPSVASIPIDGKKEIERTVWEGRPANLTAFDSFIKYGLAVFAILVGYILSRFSIPLETRFLLDYLAIGVMLVIVIKACWLYFVLRNIEWVLTTERFIYTVGVFSKRTENLELYRIKDITIRKPFFFRLFGYGVIDLITSDRTDPNLSNIGAVKNPDDLFQLFRKYIERQKRIGPVKGFEII